MSYLLSLANELMTSPMETLESMYNEAMNRSESGDLDDSIKYGKIVGLIEQAIHKRQHHIEHISGKYRAVSDFTKPGLTD